MAASLTSLPNVKEDDLDDIPPMGKRIAKPEGDHKRITEAGYWRRALQGYLLFMVAPGVTKPKGRCSRPVNLIDIYPTLIDLCTLTPKPELAGQSLVPLLKNTKRKWDRPALTTHGRNNHSLRSERWRYIQYSDGAEELYDHNNDEMEWTNLDSVPKYADIKRDFAKWLPKINVPDAPEDGELINANNREKKSKEKK